MKGLVRIGLLLMAALLFGLSEAAYAISDDALNMLALENLLESRLKSVLTEITGSDHVIVLVSADGQGETRRQDAVLLPGVPVRKEEAGGNSVRPSGKLSVKKIFVTILVDENLSEAAKTTISEVSSTVLGLSKARGDEIFIRKIDFRRKGVSWSSVLSPTNLAILLVSAVGAYFLFMASLFLRDPFAKLTEALKGAGLGNVPAANSEKSIEVQNAFTGTGSGSATSETEQPDGSTLPFAFVQERHLADLAFLLTDKAAQDIALVINYLGPEPANRLLEHFPVDRQVEVAMSLSAVNIDPEKTRALEEKVRQELDYVVGGERKLAALLSGVDEAVAEKIISRLEKKDAETAGRLRREIKGLEAYLLSMQPTGIAVLARQADTAVFAQVLKTLPDEIQKKVLGSLTAGAAERVKQEIELSRPLSPERLKKEKRNLVAVIRRLIKEGFVEVDKN